MYNTPLHMEQRLTEVRKGIIGIDHTFESPFGKKKIIYADWTASGRMYKPIEDYLIEEVYPYVANTHTETTFTGCFMTNLYHDSLNKIKQHVNANEQDSIIACNSGMTGVINKFQRMLGYKLHESFKDRITIPEEDRPIVFITHMEHHSNHTTWLETICDVVIIPPADEGGVDLEAFKALVKQYPNRKTKIASVTACSNVTGIYTPYHEIAEIIHQHDGYCFVDFACSAPYVDINMHPENELQYLDAVMFSPHKFLGGPGSSGVLVFKNELYHNMIPDHPGGGTVKWTSPYEKHLYVDSIEEREDGGTPAFLQAIRVAKAIELKEYMTTDAIQQREEHLLRKLWDRITELPNVSILESNVPHRQAILSLQFNNVYFDVVVRALNDMFGIQTRGGCSCAGTYGHYLNHLDFDKSVEIKSEIMNGNMMVKPGWVRVSLHPTMLDEEIDFIADAIQYIVENESAVNEIYKSVNNDFAIDEQLLGSDVYQPLKEKSFSMV